LEKYILCQVTFYNTDCFKAALLW